MSTPFAHTSRALRADSFHRSAWTLVIAVALVLGWGAWLFRARVPVVVVAERARLEAAAHAVQAPLAGRVAAVHVHLGQKVEAGAPMLTLDAEDARLSVAEAQSRLTGLQARLSALRRERADGEGTLRQADDALGAGLDAVQAQGVEHEAAALLAEDEAERHRALFGQGVISRAVFERAQATAVQRRAAANAHRQQLRQLGFRRQQETGDRQVRLDQLDGEVVALRGALTTTAATIARLEHEIAQREVRSPVAGRVADWSAVRVGGYVAAGDRLGSVVRDAVLCAVAYLPASAATGRIHPGQSARLRLDGFAWTQFGSLSAAVARVASDATDGRVRVELAIEPASVPRVPLQHGLTGILEIQIKQTTPAALILRHAGGLLSR